MRYFISILYAIFLSFWRRWFGGFKFKIKFLNIRFIQHIINFVITLPVLYYFSDYYIRFHIIKKIPNRNFWLSLITTIIILALFWARAHGPAFDIARDNPPSEKTIKRYKKEWWNKICEWLVPESNWYGFGYDVLWMRLRYTCCLLLLLPIKPFMFLIMGLSVPTVYSICWSLYETKPKLWETKVFKKMQINGPTALAEYIVGFISGLCLVLI